MSTDATSTTQQAGREPVLMFDGVCGNAVQRLRAPLGSIGGWALVIFGYALTFHVLYQLAGFFESQVGISVWYPPAGLRLAALLLFGWRFGLVAFAAEVMVGLLTGYPDLWFSRGEGWSVFGLAAGLIACMAIPPFSYTMAVLIGMRLRIGRRGADTLNGVGRIVCIAAMGATMSAWLSCMNLAAYGFFPWHDLFDATTSFWIGDMLGTLTLTPFLYHFGRYLTAREPFPGSLSAKKISAFVAEALGVCGIVFIAISFDAGWLLQTHSYPLLCLIIWMALRRGYTGAVVSVFLVNLLTAALVAVLGFGVLRDMQVFMMVASLTGLVMGAFVSELRRERTCLDQKVRERTTELTQEVERRRAAEGRAVAEKRRAEMYLDMTRAAIIACDSDGRLIMVNDEACALLERQRSTLQGMFIGEALACDGCLGRLQDTLDRLISGRGEPVVRFECGTECCAVRRNRQVDWRAVAVRDDTGRVTGTLWAGLDVTERVQTEKRMRHRATHDPLTGLHNRSMLPDVVAAAVSRSRRHSSRMALAYADLNDFKAINDRRGHGAGDRVLVETARRLASAVRESDAVFRVGGDEFVIILEDMADLGACERVGSKIVRAVSHPVDCDGTAVDVAVAVGVACYPDHGETLEELLAAADAAMYHRKRQPPGVGCLLAASSAKPVLQA